MASHVATQDTSAKGELNMNINSLQARYVSILLRNELENMVHEARYDASLDASLDVIINMIDGTMVQDAVARMEHETCPECGWVK